jgi:hypothetical protein
MADKEEGVDLHISGYQELSFFTTENGSRTAELDNTSQSPRLSGANFFNRKKLSINGSTTE